MTHAVPDFSALPVGRMLTILKLERGLRHGETYEVLAKRLRISLSASKVWARELGFRKCDLELETAQTRAARQVRWALALLDLGRHEEAGAWEAEARKLEGLLSRLRKRAALDKTRPDPMAPALDLVDRVRASLGEDAEAKDAFCAIAEYYTRLRAAGATLLADGRVEWLNGQQGEVPETPAWLPCDPWAVLDEAGWEVEVGRALALL